MSSGSNDLAVLDAIGLTGLEVTPTRQPRAPLQVTYLRDLTEVDRRLIEALPDIENRGNPQHVLSKLRSQHHQLARLVAEGARDHAIASITGYDPEYICTLRTKDPLFMELVAYYRAAVEAQYLTVHDRRAALGTAAIERLQERIDDDEEAAKIGTKTLVEIAEFGQGDKVKAAQAQGRGFAGGANGAPSGVTVNISFPTGDDKQSSKIIDVKANTPGDPDHGG